MHVSFSHEYRCRLEDAGIGPSLEGACIGSERLRGTSRSKAFRAWLASVTSWALYLVWSCLKLEIDLLGRTSLSTSVLDIPAQWLTWDGVWWTLSIVWRLL